jgi:hypothetical protein
MIAESVNYLEIVKQVKSLHNQIGLLEAEVEKIVEELLGDFLFVQGENSEEATFCVLWFDEDGIQAEIDSESYLIPLQFIVDPVFRKDVVENQKRRIEERKALAESRKARQEQREYEYYLTLKKKYEHN